MIAVIGEALIDLVVDEAGAVVARPGGGPFNTARTLGRLGVETTFLGRLSGDDMFTKAEESWKSGSYTQAIDQYDKFLEAFPDHTEASVARVHRGMARLRQAVEGSRDFSKTLATAKSILSEIAPEEKFGEAQNELAALLPTIADGLAKQANQRLDLAVPHRRQSVPRFSGER